MSVLRRMPLAILPALVAGAALAAEASPPAAYDWNGIYYGVHVGAGSSRNEWNNPTGSLESWAPWFFGEGTGGNGLLGLQAGYNWQFGNAVVGIEADASSANIAGAARCAIGTSACATESDYLGTMAARFGVAAGDFLVYGKAGGALIHNSRKADMTVYDNAWSSPSSWRLGWMAGVGVETGLTPSLSAKLEYDYADFGAQAQTFTDQYGNSFGASIGQNAHLIKLGLNYRPGGAAGENAMPMTAGSWTGFYAGLHQGGAMGQDKWTSATGFVDTWGFFPAERFPGEGPSEGLLAGGQIGYNQQIGDFVLGVEAAVSLSDHFGMAKCASDAAINYNWTCRNRTTAMGDVSGRLGHAFGNLLVYGKAGAAWATHSGTMEIAGVDKVYTSPKDTHWGLLFGAGAEYAFSPNLSAFVEYDRTSFGAKTTNYTIADATAEIGIHVDRHVSAVGFKQNIDAVKVGLNYRFGDPLPDAQAGSPLDGNGWSLEVGERLVAGSPRTQWDAYGYSPAYPPDHLNSRIVTDGATLQGAETFFRLDHDSGVFAKGNIGIGRLVGGRLRDEDTATVTGISYSHTASELKNGRQIVGGVDLGYNIIDDGAASFGAFVGYRSFHDHSHAFGLHQMASCDGCVSELPTNYAVISKPQSWRGVAIGLNSQVRLSERLRLDVDAAWIPHANHAGVDNHWLRADINPLVIPGRGWGTQFEAALSYDVTDRFALGIGGRYSYFATSSAYMEFPGGAVFPAKLRLRNYSGFLQASYRFGDVDTPKVQTAYQAQVDWTGAYAGVSLGSAFGRADYDDPFAPPLPGTGFAELGGVLAGGQIGFNYQMGRFVAGAELAGAWANVDGNNTCFSGYPVPMLAGFDCGARIDALASATGRAGVAFDRALIYGKAGVAWDRQTDRFNTVASILLAAGDVVEPLHSRSSNVGYTVGAGIEYALDSRWSAGLEYSYYDFGKSAAFTTGAPADLAGVNLAPRGTTLHTAALRLNYRFGVPGHAR